ncbi:MAG TPA: hypothetical protein VF623_02320 [Segetibacter sp.]
MKRSTFLKHAAKAGAFVFIRPLSNNFLAGTTINKNTNVAFDDAFLKRMVVANDLEVEKTLPLIIANKVAVSRNVSRDFGYLSAAYCSPASRYYHDTAIISPLLKLVTVLQSGQTPDGTLNIGNLGSPPDTAFLLEELTAGAALLIKDNSKDLLKVNTEVKDFLLKSGEGLMTGGVHTPNHRWVICASLSRLNALYPDKKYLDRIEDWLGEGIFIDADGHFPERSQTYSYVEDISLIAMGRLLKKPALFEPVRKNLRLTYYYMEPNGDLVTTDSRRQDQFFSKTIVSFYLHYRYMAIKDQDSNFAGIARLIENMEGFEEEIISRNIVHFLDDPLLLQQLPSPTDPSVNYEKLFATSHLLRIRRNNITSTFFGGADLPLLIASGRSNSPNIFSFRKGGAILKYLRLSTNFFSTGYFYSSGLKKEGNRYVLNGKLSVPYYQPLPKNLRKASGDYKLSPSIDDRFWNKMDFKNRPVSNVKTLETTVSLQENNGSNQLVFDVKGPAGVQVTIELCFNEGGKLTGVLPAENDNNFVETGMAEYEFGKDKIAFGPGVMAHKNIAGLEGERYSTHFGTLRTEGMHVYLTGITPFNHKLTIA